MARMQEDVSNNLSPFGHLHHLVREHPDFEVLCEPTVDRYCFRYVPNGLPADQPEVQQLLDRLNEEIVESVQREGFELITNTEVGGCVAIRISICTDVEATFEAIARWGRLVTRKQLSSVVS